MQLEAEYDYYLSNKKFFVDSCEGRYIVLFGKKLLGVYDTQLQAINKTRKTHELGTFMVKYVTREEPVLFIPRALVGKVKPKRKSK